MLPPQIPSSSAPSERSKTYGGEGVDDGDNSRLGGEALALLLGDEGLKQSRSAIPSYNPRELQSQTHSKLVDVNHRAPEGSLVLVEVPHSDLSEVSVMVLIEVGPVVVLSSSLLYEGIARRWGQRSALPSEHSLPSWCSSSQRFQSILPASSCCTLSTEIQLTNPRPPGCLRCFPTRP